MASYDVAFDQNSGFQIGHNSGNVYNTGPAPRHKVDTAFDVPDLLSQYFTGRKDELAQLKEIYRASTTDGPARCIVYGMPGLGKTQLALQFAYSNKKDYPFIFWISGASIEKLNSGFSAILDHVGGEARDESARNRAAKKWFETQEKRWLLVVDNVNEQTVSHLRDILPVSNAKGNVFITTRYQNVAESLGFAHGEKHNTIDLQNLGENDAVQLFFAIRHKSDADDIDSGEHEGARIITKKVGYLPLAIDQAASLSNTPGQTVHKVLEIYSHPELNEVLRWPSESTKHEDTSVMACFGPVLDQLNKSSPEAGILLRILAFLDPESIPIELITDGIIDFKPRDNNIYHSVSPQPVSQPSRMRRLKNRLLKKNTEVKAKVIPNTIDNTYSQDREDMQLLRAIFESPVKLPKLIQALARFSIVKFKDDDESTIWIHDLVHHLIRQNLMDEDQRSRWLEIAIEVISESLGYIKDPSAVENWKQTAKFVAHVQKLREHLTAQKADNKELIMLEDWITSYLYERGSYTEAVKILERIVAARQMSLGKEDPATLESTSSLALLYSKMGKLKDAEELQLETLALQKRVLGTEHPNTLTSMNNLSLTYYYQGRLKEAEELQVETFAQEKRILDAEHSDTLTSMDNLANTYHGQGRLKKAEELYTKMLAMRKKVLGAEHPNTLTSMNNLSLTYYDQGRLKEAEELQVETLATQKKVLGAEHPNTLTSMNNLSLTYYDQGRLKEAEELQVETLAQEKRVLGAEHPDTLRSMNNYAITLKAKGNTEEAIELMKTALEGQSQILGTEHYKTRESADALALWEDERDPDPSGDDSSVHDTGS